jgi:sulfur-oxidizing protein SoxX
MTKIRSLAQVATLAAAAALFGCSTPLPSIAPEKADATIKAAFVNPPDPFKPRLAQDETMRQCSEARNDPPAALGEAISKREAATIKYPADGNLMGDWKRGEALAQSGYGLRFSDYPATRPNGGNCYACHQISKAEVSFGTLGPSLAEYGKLKDFSAEATKAVYDKIYNSHAANPCSLMPRFGANGVLTIEQIKDAVALLMSKDSPVNQ